MQQPKRRVRPGNGEDYLGADWGNLELEHVELTVKSQQGFANGVLSLGELLFVLRSKSGAVSCILTSGLPIPVGPPDGCFPSL